MSSVTLIGTPKKVSPEEAKVGRRTPTKDNDAAAAIIKDESIELVDQSDEDVKYKAEEQEKEKKKPEEKFKISQRFSEVMSVCTFIMSHPYQFIGTLKVYTVLETSKTLNSRYVDLKSLCTLFLNLVIFLN